MKLKENRVGGCGLDSSGSGEASVAHFQQHGNENLDSKEGKEFLEWQEECKLLKKGSTVPLNELAV